MSDHPRLREAIARLEGMGAETERYAVVQAVLGMGSRETAKWRMPASWFAEGLPDTHKALDEAIEQGGICPQHPGCREGAEVIRESALAPEPLSRS
jgi:hypothetical protein